MSITYGDLMNLMESNPDIMELRIDEGSFLYLGISKQMERPLIIADRNFTESVEYTSLAELGIIERGECLNILLNFQEQLNVRLIPDENNPIIVYENDVFRLAVIDRPHSSYGFSITFRKFHQV
jgi:hypothetical protein